MHIYKIQYAYLKKACMLLSTNLWLYNLFQWTNSVKTATYVTELCAILDSFYTCITSDYIGEKSGGSHEVVGFSFVQAEHSQMVSFEVFLSSRYHKW